MFRHFEGQCSMRTISNLWDNKREFMIGNRYKKERRNNCSLFFSIDLRFLGKKQHDRFRSQLLKTTYEKCHLPPTRVLFLRSVSDHDDDIVDTQQRLWATLKPHLGLYTDRTKNSRCICPNDVMPIPQIWWSSVYFWCLRFHFDFLLFLEHRSQMIGVG